MASETGTRRGRWAIAAGVTAVIAAALGYAAWAAERDEVRHAEARAIELARATAHVQARIAAQTYRLLAAAASGPALADGADACERAVGGRSVPGVLDNLAAFDRSGALRCAARPGLGALGAADLAWLAGIAGVASGARMTTLADEPVLLVARPLGDIALVAVVALDARGDLQLGAAADDRSLTLFDLDQRVLLHHAGGVRWSRKTTSPVDADRGDRRYGVAPIAGDDGAVLAHVAVGVPLPGSAARGRVAAEALGLAGLSLALGLAIEAAVRRRWWPVRRPGRTGLRPRRRAHRAPGEAAPPAAAPDQPSGRPDRAPPGRDGRVARIARGLVEQHERERRAVVGVLQRDVGELLAGLAASLGELVRGVPREAASALAEAHELVGDLAQRTRELIDEIRPPALDELGLTAALDDRLRRFEIETGIDATLRHSVVGAQPGPMVAITLYRVVVEALRLVSCRGAHGVLVRLHAAGGRIHLELRERRAEAAGDGPATAGAAALSSSALGLLEETIELLGGSTSHPVGGDGALLAIDLPLDEGGPVGWRPGSGDLGGLQTAPPPR